MTCSSCDVDRRKFHNLVIYLQQYSVSTLVFLWHGVQLLGLWSRSTRPHKVDPPLSKWAHTIDIFTPNLSLYVQNYQHRRSIGLPWLLNYPDSKVHGVNMGPTWVLSPPDGPHVGPMNLAIRVLHMNWNTDVKSLLPVRCGNNFESMAIKLMIQSNNRGTRSEITHRWMPQNITNEKSILVHVMDSCRQAKRHYVNQC